MSELVGKRNAEIDSIRKNMPQSRTSFTTGAGLTAGGYGLGRLAAMLKRFGPVGKSRAGLIGAGLTAGGIAAKDTLMPTQTKLPTSVATKWVDPSNPPKSTPSSFMDKIRELIGLQKEKESVKWVTDKKYPGMVGN